MGSAVVMPSMSLRQGRAVVSSVSVAEHFRKQHKHVLDSIRDIIRDAPAEFNEPNFRPVEYRDAKGERRPAYDLTRDGFTLLAMGFTGKRALAWKVRYIQAFNALEAEVMRLRREPRPGRITPQDVRELMDEQYTRLGRARLNPDHPLAETWEREAYEYIHAITAEDKARAKRKRELWEKIG